MRIYNNNPAFGDCGPFDVDAASFEEACALLVGEMDPLFNTWLNEQELQRADHIFFHENVPELAPRQDRLREMQRTFVAGLEQVP